VQYYNLWQTAAAEGIAVFVAAGDSGSASCDDGGDASGVPYAAEYGLTVSGLASTPWNTAVGGTDFDWCPLLTAVEGTTTSNDCQAAPYWSPTELTPKGYTSASYTALGYVPEVPWNDTCTSPLALSYLEWFWEGNTYKASNGTNYSVTDAETGCNAIGYYASELESSGDTDDLYLVDTVGGSGGASSCVVNTTNPTGTTYGSCTTGVTTTGSTNNPDTNAPQPTFTVTTTDGWPSPGWQYQSGVPGTSTLTTRAIPDVSFFASDGFLSSSAYLICVSPAASYYYNDQPCSYSTNEEPFAQEVGGTSVATPAMAGIMALINQKAGAAQGSPNQELYTLAASQPYSSCSAERGNGQPVTSSTCLFNDIDQGTNAMACDYSGYVTTPSPNCSIAHAGDYFGILNGYSAAKGYDEATGLGSLNVANVVNAWTAMIGSAAAIVTVTPGVASLNTDNWLGVTVTVASAKSGGTTPTGEVTLVASTSGGSTLTTLVGALSSTGSYTFNIPPDTLSAGTDMLAANYGGDSNYAPASNTAQVTVSDGPLTTSTVTVKPAASSTNSNASLGVTVTVTPATPTPTGTVFLSGGGYSSSVPWPALSGGSYTFTIPANTLSATASGQSDTLTATYSGDANYSANTGANIVTVLESTFALTPGTPSSSSVTPGQSATVAVAVAAKNGYTGTVSLSCAQSGTTATNSDGTTCTASGSSQVNLATCGSSCSVTFTIGTTASYTAKLERPAIPGSEGPGGKGPGDRELLGAGSGALLALLVFFGIPARRRSWRAMLSLLVVMVAIGTLASCSGGSSGGGGNTYTDPGTTAGTYTYTVTATPNPSVSPTVATTFQVVVN
jgi:hypothetical protein